MLHAEVSIRDALLRSGLCEHGNLERDVMRFIKSYDDIILAPDTNVLLNCIITAILLPKIKEKINEEPKGCPNWILIAIPKLVINEIENQAVRRYHPREFPARAGWPDYNGRIGQRGLQEILELDTSINHRGVSIMTIGELPSNFDSLRSDPIRRDSEIRSQVREFISRISFHKGIFFITQDRVNAMMARAEGLQSLFLQKPEYNDLVGKHLINTDVAHVLYEVTVSFGEIKVEGLGRFSVFWPEKHVDDWEKSRLMITEVF
ncbi:MAG: PIN domain-containing protein [Candidatus Bathycorpusculaceae bacterium]